MRNVGMMVAAAVPLPQRGGRTCGAAGGAFMWNGARRSWAPEETHFAERGPRRLPP